MLIDYLSKNPRIFASWINHVQPVLWVESNQQSTFSNTYVLIVLNNLNYSMTWQIKLRSQLTLKSHTVNLKIVCSFIFRERWNSTGWITGEEYEYGFWYFLPCCILYIFPVQCTMTFTLDCWLLPCCFLLL